MDKLLATNSTNTIWSGMQQRVIGEAIDHVVWTAARLCEN